MNLTMKGSLPVKLDKTPLTNPYRIGLNNIANNNAVLRADSCLRLDF